MIGNICLLERPHEQAGEGHLGHEHLEQALFEVADLSPDILVGLARAGHMVQRCYQAMAGHQPPPAQQKARPSHQTEASEGSNVTFVAISGPGACAH